VDHVVGQDGTVAAGVNELAVKVKELEDADEVAPAPGGADKGVVLEKEEYVVCKK
jgi:hypothetical protein